MQHACEVEALVSERVKALLILHAVVFVRLDGKPRDRQSNCPQTIMLGKLNQWISMIRLVVHLHALKHICCCSKDQWFGSDSIEIHLPIHCKFLPSKENDRTRTSCMKETRETDCNAIHALQSMCCAIHPSIAMLNLCVTSNFGWISRRYIVPWFVHTICELYCLISSLVYLGDLRSERCCCIVYKTISGNSPNRKLSIPLPAPIPCTTATEATQSAIQTCDCPQATAPIPSTTTTEATAGKSKTCQCHSRFWFVLSLRERERETILLCMPI